MFAYIPFFCRIILLSLGVIVRIHGEFPKTTAIPLSELKISSKGKVVAVEMDEPSFLKYLDKLNISIGTQVVVLEVNEFDNSIDIKIDNVQRHVSLDVAKNILISVL